jgi:hypothetical protein
MQIHWNSCTVQQSPCDLQITEEFRHLFSDAASLREVWPRDSILHQGSTMVAGTDYAMLIGLLDSIADDYDEGS